LVLSFLEQENIWRKEETVEDEKTSLSCSYMGDCEDKTKRKDSSSATSVEKTEAQREMRT